MITKKPFISYDQAIAIAKNYPTPFYIYDENGIVETARAVNKAFSWNKGFKEYFAVKANANPALISLLRQEGCGLDCSSYAELKEAGALGAKGEDIMFSSNDTPLEEFTYANSLGAIINLDDITHIDSLEKVCPVLPSIICCRYNPGGVIDLSNGIMDNPGDSKYGMTKAQLFEAYKRLKELGVTRFGLHAFLVSNTMTNEYYPLLAGKLFRIAVELKKQLGIELSFINLSGGVGIPYMPGDSPNDIFAIGEGVRNQYNRILVPEGLTEVAIFTEMGRFMMGPHGALVTKAIHEKHIYKEYIGVDACASNLIRPAMYGAYHHITVLGKENAPATKVYDVVGSLCENNDKFAVDRVLPEIQNGDLIYIHDAGAHAFSMGYNYNGRLWCAELLLEKDGGVRLIRRAQDLRDYFATLDVLPIYERLISD